MRFLAHRVTSVTTSVRTEALVAPTDTVVVTGIPLSSLAAAMIAKQSPAMHAAIMTNTLPTINTNLQVFPESLSRSEMSSRVEEGRPGAELPGRLGDTWGTGGTGAPRGVNLEGHRIVQSPDVTQGAALGGRLALNSDPARAWYLAVRAVPACG